MSEQLSMCIILKVNFSRRFHQIVTTICHYYLQSLICPRGAVRLDLVLLSEKWLNRNRCPKERFPLVNTNIWNGFCSEEGGVQYCTVQYFE